MHQSPPTGFAGQAGMGEVRPGSLPNRERTDAAPSCFYVFFLFGTELRGGEGLRSAHGFAARNCRCPVRAFTRNLRGDPQ